MLRVIAGKYGSRKLHEVPGKTTRPTTDKNKESMFNSLGQFFNGGHVLDLFAGSGALGVEALSRGMEKATFVEKNHKAYQVVKTNIESLGIDAFSTITIQKDAILHLKSTEDRYDLIIADPPYALNPYVDILTIISTRHLLNNNGIIVME